MSKLLNEYDYAAVHAQAQELMKKRNLKLKQKRLRMRFREEFNITWQTIIRLHWRSRRQMGHTYMILMEIDTSISSVREVRQFSETIGLQ